MTAIKVISVTTTVLAAAANAYAAANDFARPRWLMENMMRMRIPESQLATLGFLKAAGALGLVAGLAVPWVGTVSAACLIVFFLAAVRFAVRVRFYSHLGYPLTWLALVSVALVFMLAAR